MVDAAPHSESTPTPLALPHEEYGKGWRWLTVLAGLALAASFFIPFTGHESMIPRITGGTMTAPQSNPADSHTFADTPWNTCRYTITSLANSPITLWPQHLIYVFGCLVQSMIPQLWGLALGLCSLAHLFKCDRTRRLIGRLGLILTTAFGLLLMAFFVVVFVVSYRAAPANTPSTLIVLTFAVYGIIVVFFMLMPLIHALLAICHKPWTYLYHGFTPAFLLVMPLGVIYILAYKSNLGWNGVTILIVTACLLLLARVGEARAVSRLSWYRTIVGLFFLRLHRWALPPGHCPACGYNLHALTQPRCPECGRPFTPQEAGLSSPAISATASIKEI